MAEGPETDHHHHHQPPSSNSPPFSSSSSPTPSTSGQSLPKSQGMNVSGSQSPQNAVPQMFPMVFSSILAPQQDQEQNGFGPGLYAVPYSPFMGRMPEFPPSTLIPLNYKIPTRTNSANAVGEQEGQGQEAGRQQHGPQRQVVVRRFQFALQLQLDLGLLLKLVAVVILFGQEGSRQRFFLLVGFAVLVYLYQTGALTPLIQYLRRAAGPPPPRHAENHGIARRPEDNAGIENQNQPAEAEAAPAANGNQQEPAGGNGFNWMGIAREIQTFIVGFVASLLPGFRHNE